MRDVVDEVGVRAESAGLAAVPSAVYELFRHAKAPARLVAHLHLVHDVATLLTAGCHSVASAFDERAIAFGAATHDIGKALHPNELRASGSQHETSGERWLIEQGCEPQLARFARTHGLHASDASLMIEDLFVIAADKLWKGKRVVEVEERLVRELAKCTDAEFWDLWSQLSALFDDVADGADRRLQWQSEFSV
ncbi:MAG: phosphohydrolase [Myxococcota bacterium]